MIVYCFLCDLLYCEMVPLNSGEMLYEHHDN